MSLLTRLLGTGETKRGLISAEIETPTVTIEPVHITDAEFESVVLQSDKPVLLDLWADWCVPCHMIAPAVEDLAVEFDGQALVAKIDVDANPMVPQKYGIMGIPTLLLFKEGQEADRIVGVTTYGNLRKHLTALL